MKSCLIIFGVFILVVTVIAYLTHGSEVWKDIKSRKSRIVDSCVPLKNLQNVKIANGPVLCVKCPGETEYRQVKILNRTTRIGSSKSSEVVLCDEFVEPIHAIIKKEVRNNKARYEFINMSKYNPIQWFNQKKNDYEDVGYRRGVVLDSQEIFYIGESKVIVKCPVVIHTPSKTERLVLNENKARENGKNGMTEEERNDLSGSEVRTYERTRNAACDTREKVGRTRVYDFKSKAV